MISLGSFTSSVPSILGMTCSTFFKPLEPRCDDLADLRLAEIALEDGDESFLNHAAFYFSAERRQVPQRGRKIGTGRSA